MKLDARLRQKIDASITRRMHSATPLHLFMGVGTARLLDWLIRHEKLSVHISGNVVRQTGGLVTGATYLVGLFSHFDQHGYHESDDFYEALTVAAAQAFGILPQVGKKVVFRRRRKGDGTDGTLGVEDLCIETK